jgi:hypothetical protein
MFQYAAAAAGLERFGTHTMRHADIRTTMNVYGTVVTDEMATASGKVARLVVNGTGDGAEPRSSH